MGEIMKHIKQGLNECFPTVLAMLSGIDVNKILADAQVISPVVHNWARFNAGEVKPDDDVSMVYRALARKYAPYLVEHCAPVSVNVLLRDNRYLGYYEFIAKTARGKGAVLLGSRFRTKPCAHIAAYEDGLIYCGNQDGTMKARDYYILCAKLTPLCPYGVVSEY